MSLEKAIEQRAEARKDTRRVLEKAKELRRAELEARAKAYAEAGNSTMESAIMELINREKSKNSWKKIKRALEKSDFSSLTQLIVPITGTDKEEIITKKDEIHNAIIDYNITHYSKPEGSPFGLGTFLCDAIGPHGTSEYSDRILEGKLDDTDRQEINFDEAYKLLNFMKYQDLKPEDRSLSE